MISFNPEGPGTLTVHPELLDSKLRYTKIRMRLNFKVKKFYALRGCSLKTLVKPIVSLLLRLCRFKLLLGTTMSSNSKKALLMRIFGIFRSKCNTFDLFYLFLEDSSFKRIIKRVMRNNGRMKTKY